MCIWGVIDAAPSFGHIGLTFVQSLDLTLILSPLLPTTPSHLHAFYKFLCDIRGYNPSFDPYYAYLEDMPGKIEWNSFFDHSFDFSMAFDKGMRTLTALATFVICVLLLISC